ncbi:MAG: hypothetical protein OEW72_09905 [Gammaproteobacteria bacterium]|nr:hypothetical protein [Gammaproteobacteria bacterium]
MKMKMKIVAGLLVGLSIASSSQAASISYFLDQSNKLADGVNYLKVTIDDEGALGAINFTVEALQPLLDLAGPNFGIQKFAFNILGGVGAEADDVDLPGGWRARNGGRMDGFGLFDVTLKGKGNKRQDPLTFSITGVDLDTIQSYVDLSSGRSPQGFSLFSAHVAGFELCDGDSYPDGKKSHGGCRHSASSAYFGGTQVVPAPPAIWLLGTAIAGLAVRRFRAGSKAAAA